MSSNDKESKSGLVVNNKQNNRNNECPKKEGDNCLVPGAYSDSAPIGGG